MTVVWTEAICVGHKYLENIDELGKNKLQQLIQWPRM
jgi:hypothetical protein